MPQEAPTLKRTLLNGSDCVSPLASVSPLACQCVPSCHDNLSIEEAAVTTPQAQNASFENNEYSRITFSCCVREGGGKMRSFNWSLHGGANLSSYT